MQNLLLNPYLPFTLADLLFEKGSVHEPIANKLDLSAARRAAALNQIVLIDQVLEVFTASVHLDIDVTDKTGQQLIEQTYGQTLAELIKGAGLVTKAAQATLVAGDHMRSWLNKGASWLAEKTNKTT
jgi:hypothetical protein